MWRLGFFVSRRKSTCGGRSYFCACYAGRVDSGALSLFITIEGRSTGSIRKFQIGSHPIRAAVLIITDPRTSVG